MPAGVVRYRSPGLPCHSASNASGSGLTLASIPVNLGAEDRVGPFRDI